MTRLLLFGQGVYFAITGLWALLHIRSFQAVTGPKTDLWLVKTVGALVLAIGAVLSLSSRRREPPAESALLAVGSSAALAGIDVFYSLRGRISKIYLADAVVEVLLALMMLASWPRNRRSNA